MLTQLGGDERQVEAETAPEPPAHVNETAPFRLGDAVTLSGTVAEVQHLQGEDWNLRVEHDGGSLWLPARHVAKAYTAPPQIKARLKPGNIK